MCLARVDLPSVSVPLTWPSNGLDNYMVGALPTIRKEERLQAFFSSRARYKAE